MSDDDIFAIFTAGSEQDLASTAFRLPHNSRWFQGVTRSEVAEAPTIASGEATPIPAEPDQKLNQLVITFDALQDNLQNGLQFGTNPRACHILLGHRGTKGVSARQFNIVVDKELRIWLKDYHSTHGTAVGHDGQNSDLRRKKETWILAYRPGSASDQNPTFAWTTINMGKFGLEVRFPNHVAPSAKYLQNLRDFVQRCGLAAGTPAINGLGIESRLTTKANTQPPSVSGRSIYYTGKTVGRGPFSKVLVAYRARDGGVLAAKVFEPQPNKRKHEEESPAWMDKLRTEFELMKTNTHASIKTCHSERDSMLIAILIAEYR